MNKKILTLFISLISGSSFAISGESDFYKMRVPLLDKTGLSNWSKTESLYTEWENTGEHYSCLEWTPNESTVDYGSDFIQSRDCNQNQERIETVRLYDPFSDTYKSGEKINHDRVVIESESKSSIGTKNFISGSSYGAWSAWVNDGQIYNCGEFSPAASTVNSGVQFQQSRTCKQNQTRQRAQYDTWADGSKSISSYQDDSQTIDVTDTQMETGTKVAKTCHYDLSSLNTLTYVTDWNGVNNYFWQGNNYGTGVLGGTKVVGSYRYSRGAYKYTNAGNGVKVYQICREKI